MYRYAVTVTKLDKQHDNNCNIKLWQLATGNWQLATGNWQQIRIHVSFVYLLYQFRITAP